MDEPVIVARVARAHGIKGGLLLDVETDHAEALFQPGRRLHVVGGSGTAPGAIAALTVVSARDHSGRLLVVAEEVADRNAAESLRGAKVCVPRGELPDLEDGQYLLHDLVGMDVLEGARSLGRVTDVYDFPAGPMLAVDVDGRERLIPLNDDIVDGVDLDAGEVRVTLPAGLLDI